MPKKQEENLLMPIFDLVKQTWRHRPELKIGKKVIWTDQTINAAVLDTLDALQIESKLGLKPLLVKSILTDYGRRIILSLPPGISVNDIEKKIDYFEEQSKGNIFLSNNGKTLFMDIYTVELPTKIGYEFTGDYKDYIVPFPVGMLPNGNMLIVDMSKIPHVFVAGNTGRGKSNAIHAIANFLIQANCLCNKNISVVIIDLKMLEFAYLENHALVCDEEESACNVLRDLNKELDRRLKILKASKCVNLTEYQGKDIPFTIVIIDELTELKDKKAQEDLNRICRLGRAPGLYVVAATQRPSHTVFKNFTDTRALFQATLCFSVKEALESRIALGNDSADKIPKDVPGRGIWQWDQQTLIQAMYINIKNAAKEIQKLPPQKKVIELHDKELPAR